MISLKDIKETSQIDCCQALTWIEHNYTKLPHEHTPRYSDVSATNRRHKTKSEIENEKRIKNTIEKFKSISQNIILRTKKGT